MRRVLVLVGCLAAAACAPQPPDNGQLRGVGFDGDAADLQPVETAGLPALTGPFVAGQQISDEGGASFESTVAPAATSVVQAQPQQTPRPAPAPAPATDNPGISDEQDFSAVSARESIESDRARLEAQREAYKLIQPGALPTRRGNGGAAIVEFALATNHPVGQTVYRRSGLNGQNRFDRNCTKYASQDQAQAAFLGAGGPERDRMGLDPDGDGYACYWDPTGYRAAVGN